MRRAGAPVSMPTDDRGRHAKGRCLRPGRSEQRSMVGSFVQRTLPPVGAGGRAEHRVVDHPMPVAATDDGPPLGERQVVSREHPLF